GLASCGIALLTRAGELPGEISHPSAPARPGRRTPAIAAELAPLLQSAHHRPPVGLSSHIDPANPPAIPAPLTDVRPPRHSVGGARAEGELARYGGGGARGRWPRDASERPRGGERSRIRDWHDLQRAIGRHNRADSGAVNGAPSYPIGADPPRLTLLLQEHAE